MLFAMLILLPLSNIYFLVIFYHPDWNSCLAFEKDSALHLVVLSLGVMV